MTPMPGHAGNIVGRIADQRLHLDHLVGRDAEFLDYAFFADQLVLHGVVHDDARLDDLHQVLVGRDHGDIRTRVSSLDRISGDQVVGLEAFLLDTGEIEGTHRVAHQRELGNEVLWGLGPVGLVAAIQIRAERFRRVIEDHRHMGRRGEFVRLPQELP